MTPRWWRSRRSLVVLWLAATATVVVVLVARAPDWMRVWPLASAIADQGVVFAAPVVAAGTCLITQRRRAELSPELPVTVPRGVRRQRAAEIVSCVLVPVSVAVTAHAVAWVVATVSGATGSPRLGYPALTATTLVLAALVGYGVGRSVALRLAGPVLAVALLFGIVVWPTPDLPFWYVINGWPQLDVSVPVLVLRAVWALALATLLAVASRRHVATSAVVAGLTAAVTLGAVAAGSPVTAAVSDGQVCTDTDLRVCLWPDNAYHLTEVSSIAEAVLGAAAGTVPVPPAPLVEEGLATGHPEMDQESSAVSVRGGAPDIAFSMVVAWLDQVPSCPESTLSDDPDDYVLYTQWLLERVGVLIGEETITWDLGEDQVAELDAVRSFPEQDQLAWALTRVERAQQCL
ncbi:DUF7224 domain-containing protein [Cellulomonas triticagri]|uniref:DUF7224 domain-containing protein n=1 Tax=Cellulomonas triticagri TaxID=2483352 RepID=A0A3M2J3X5_9CELL|nr:hypothetical protein [Cellulomonas triticagri]RMI06600.1 hypothetical protein EBM89_15890 [Cellulomonas triticagri]